MSGSVHIYAEPDDLIVDGSVTSDDHHHDHHHHLQLRQLDPAHVIIDAVLQRGIELLTKRSRAVWTAKR